MLDFNELNSILKSDLCSGCGACSVADERLSMGLNSDGFYRPIAAENNYLPNENIIPLKLICPSVELDVEQIGSQRDLIWGRIDNLALAFAKNDAVRKAGSSGGVISAISQYLVDSGQVDYVINTTHSLDPILNETTVKDKFYPYINAAGSRYSPSAPCEAIREILNDDRDVTYAFIGKPCDVAAAKKLAEVYPVLRNKIRYHISFMCAGIPSVGGTEDILKHLNVKRLNLKSFKYRGDGWPGLTVAETRDGKQYSMDYNKSWGSILNKKIQHRCKVCIDGIGEFADIVCADGWECDDKGYPLFSEREGQSLLIARNDVGTNLYNELIDNNIVSSVEIKTDLKNIQPFQYYRRISILFRLIAMKVLGKRVPNYKGFHMLALASKGGIIKNLKAFSGLVTRRHKILKREL